MGDYLDLDLLDDYNDVMQDYLDLDEFNEGQDYCDLEDDYLDLDLLDNYNEEQTDDLLDLLDDSENENQDIWDLEDDCNTSENDYLDLLEGSEIENQDYWDLEDEDYMNHESYETEFFENANDFFKLSENIPKHSNVLESNINISEDKEDSVSEIISFLDFPKGKKEIEISTTFRKDVHQVICSYGWHCCMKLIETEDLKKM